MLTEQHGILILLYIQHESLIWNNDAEQGNVSCGAKLP